MWPSATPASLGGANCATASEGIDRVKLSARVEAKERSVMAVSLWCVVTLIAYALRMRIAAMTRVAGHDLRAVREYARAREVSVDLPNEQDHVSRDVLPRVRFGFERSPAAVAVRAIDVERVAELVHHAA